MKPFIDITTLEYFEFEDNADPKLYAHLTACPKRTDLLATYLDSEWIVDPAAQRAMQSLLIQGQIDQLEMQSLMNRGAREMAMRQIEERAQLDATAENTAEQILAVQPFYVKLKQVDNQISALRAQL